MEPYQGLKQSIGVGPSIKDPPSQHRGGEIAKIPAGRREQKDIKEDLKVEMKEEKAAQEYIEEEIKDEEEAIGIMRYLR